VPSSPDADVDRLFQLPLSEFTRARNVLAAARTKTGNEDDGEAVRALAKPSVSAWVVNQLHWRHRRDVDALLDVGERFRKAQAAQLAGKDADLRPLLEARRDASARLAGHAATLLQETGHRPTAVLLRRVTTTLEALAAYGTSADGPSAGHLSADVDPPGFDALAGLVSGVAGRPAARATARVLPLHRGRDPRHDRAGSADATGRRHEERRARQGEAREAVRAADVAVRAARRAESEVKLALEKATARARTAAREKDAAEKAYERATAAAEETARDAHRLARDAERATKTVADAERELERARAAEARTRSG
jgi:hypothetical protein